MREGGRRAEEAVPSSSEGCRGGMFGQWEFGDPWGVEGQKAGADAAAAAAAAEEGTDPMWVIQVPNVEEADTSTLLSYKGDTGYRIWRTGQIQPYLLYLEAAQIPDTADTEG